MLDIQNAGTTITDGFNSISGFISKGLSSNFNGLSADNADMIGKGVTAALGAAVAYGVLSFGRGLISNFASFAMNNMMTMVMGTALGALGLNTVANGATPAAPTPNNHPGMR